MRRFLVSALTVIILITFACESPKTESDYAKMASKALDNGDQETALNYYKKTLELYPKTENAEKYRDNMREILSELVKNTNSREKKVSYLRELLELNEKKNAVKSLWARFELANLTADKQPEKAEKHFNNIKFSEYDRLARYFIGQQQYQDALSCYKKSEKLYPHNRDIDKVKFMQAYIMGEYLEKPSEAKKKFKKFAHNHPQSELADDAKWMAKNVGKAPNVPIEEKQSGKKSPKDTKE